jgi:hypothetical protein
MSADKTDTAARAATKLIDLVEATGEPGPLRKLSDLSDLIAAALVNSPDFLNYQVAQRSDIGDGNELFWIDLKAPNGETIELELTRGTPLSDGDGGPDFGPTDVPAGWLDSTARRTLAKDAETDDVSRAALKRLDEAHAVSPRRD